MLKLKGNRPRPRVALVGNFEEETVEALKILFPTLWMSQGLASLKKIVSPEEVDVTIIGPDFVPPGSGIEANDFIASTHVICFSKSVTSLPGPLKHTSVVLSEYSSTEEYFISEMPLQKYNLIEKDLARLENAKGLPTLELRVVYYGPPGNQAKKLEKIFNDGALFFQPHTNLPFAIIFKRAGTKLGLAWLPGENYSMLAWIELICGEWAAQDQLRLPNFGDWTKTPDWMTSEEIVLRDEINALTFDLERLASDYQIRIATTEERLYHITLLENTRKRRLLTAQGDELLGAVASAFEELGFSVTLLDKELDANSPKREDLRLRDPDAENWDAIVEVRGHAKSSGQSSDLQRLSKFARLYLAEVGKEPNKLIYVVNGQTEIPSPQQRQVPFSAAQDDVIAFSEQGGLIIWSPDFFKALKLIRTEDDRVRCRKSIRDSIGRWLPIK